MGNLVHENKTMPTTTRSGRQPLKKKKKPSSAIQHVTVAEVRSHLDFIRKSYLDNTVFFYPGMRLNDQYTLEEFSMAFIRGNHNKRLHKHRRT